MMNSMKPFYQAGILILTLCISSCDYVEGGDEISTTDNNLVVPNTPVVANAPMPALEDKSFWDTLKESLKPISDAAGYVGAVSKIVDFVKGLLGIQDALGNAVAKIIDHMDTLAFLNLKGDVVGLQNTLVDMPYLDKESQKNKAIDWVKDADGVLAKIQVLVENNDQTIGIQLANDYNLLVIIQAAIIEKYYHTTSPADRKIIIAAKLNTAETMNRLLLGGYADESRLPISFPEVGGSLAPLPIYKDQEGLIYKYWKSKIGDMALKMDSSSGPFGFGYNNTYYRWPDKVRRDKGFRDMYQSTWAMNEVMRTFLISDTGYPDNLTWVLI